VHPGSRTKSSVPLVLDEKHPSEALRSQDDKKKAHRVLWYPTQAKERLEWGTQPSFMSRIPKKSQARSGAQDDDSVGEPKEKPQVPPLRSGSTAGRDRRDDKFVLKADHFARKINKITASQRSPAFEITLALQRR
jgi:hypothetical protein